MRGKDLLVRGAIATGGAPAIGHWPGTQQTHRLHPHTKGEGVMSVLSARVDHKSAKYIMYACMAAPAVAFGLRMVKSAME